MSSPLQSTVYVTLDALLCPGLCTCYSYCLRLPFPALFLCVMLPLSLGLKDSLVFPTHLSVLSHSAEFTSLPEVLWGVKLGGFYFFHCISSPATRTLSDTELKQRKGT